nr:sulfite oxidase-like [Ciona intestinalis]|eukprot:XP_002125613.2 sulfite oxidase-like [Ciona intestinalis]
MSSLSKAVRLLSSSTSCCAVRCVCSRYYSKGRSWEHQNNKNRKRIRYLTGASFSSLAAYISYQKYANDGESENLQAHTANAKSFPVYSSQEIMKHTTKDNGIWVSYKDGVYDITEFVDSHPGGEKILLASGGPIDPFWNMYAVHKSEEVLEILEQYKIGILSPEDQKPIDLNDPFAKEPARLPVFRINSKKPFNAEPPLELLTDSYITPNDLFYVRNHLPVPDIDPETYRLKVDVGDTHLEFSLNDLKTKFKPVTITTTIQCAGNRREEMSEFKTVKGLSWGPCAIGTARWTGVRVRDILLHAGYDVEDKAIKHIHFNGNDEDVTNTSYGASIPKQKVMSPDGDVILAYKMNGVDIPRDHGYPVRAIVPGYVGARNVKWLSHVTVGAEESTSHWQMNDYKGFSPNTTFETADYKNTPSIQEMPVISAISVPKANTIVDPEDGMVEVKGYAWSGGGRDIIRVDVSPDGGKTWKEATLTKDEPNADDSSHCWSWTLWRAEVPVKTGQTEITCKAIDSSYNCQPEWIGPIWNLRGFLTNAWHRVKVTVADEDE